MTNAIDYVIRIRAPNASLTDRAILTNTETIGAIRNQFGLSATQGTILRAEWETSPDGNSGAGIFIINEDITVNPKDLVTVYTPPRNNENTSLYQARYTGFVESMTNPNDESGNPLLLRTVGLKEWLRDVPTANQEYSVGSGSRESDNEPSSFLPTDLVIVARNIFSGAGTPPFMNNISPVEFSGVTTTALINPGRATLYDAISALEQLALEGGVTINWGVNPDRQFFFEVPTSDTLLFLEGSSEGLLEWLPVDATDTVNAVRWLIADGTARARLANKDYVIRLDTPDTATHLSENSASVVSTTHTLVAQPDKPENSVVKLTASPEVGPLATLVDSYVGDTKDAVEVLSRVDDGNPASYSIVTATPEQETALVRVDLDELANLGELVGIRARIRPLGETLAVVLVRANFVISGVLAGAARSWAGYSYAETFSDEREIYVVFGDRAREGAELISGSDGGYAALTVTVLSGSQSFAIEDFRVFRINATALDAAARDQYQDPELNGVKVTLFSDRAVPQDIDITTAGGASVGVDVTRGRYRILGPGQGSPQGFSLELIAGDDTPVADQAEIKNTQRFAQQESLKASRARRERNSERS